MSATPPPPPPPPPPAPGPAPGAAPAAKAAGRAGAPPASPHRTSLRTHACGEVGAALVGAQVTLCGAAERIASNADFHLRDSHGAVRVLLEPLALADLVDKQLQASGPVESRKLTEESIVEVQGTVEVAPDDPPGAVRVRAGTARILSFALSPLLYDFRRDDLPLRERIRHRYLYLRRPSIHAAFRARTKLVHEARRFLVARGFLEVTTPLLANRFTPEAEESFLAVRAPGRIFALPGRRPLHGSLLMAGGFDRVFEVARRFQRKPRYGPFQQPEFSVLDISLAFVDEGELHALEDALIAHVWAATTGAAPPAVTTLTSEEAHARFGTGAPDLRFESELVDGGALGGAPAARAARFAGQAAKAAAARAALAPLAGELPAGASLHLVAVPAAGAPATAGEPLALAATPALDAASAAAAATAAGGQPGDLVVVALAPGPLAAAAAAGRARAALGPALGLATGPRRLARVTRLPYFRFDEGPATWRLTGEPLTRPVEGELDDDPHRLHALAHHLVLDGVNIGGGGLKNHDLTLQRRLFEVLGLGAAEIDERFGQALAALRFGVPPHGRIAVGIDRLVARLLGLDRIDEVIALPKMPEGNDPLTRAPTPADRGLLPGMLGL